MSSTIDNLLLAIIYLISSFLLFFIGKKVYQLFHPKINVKDELVEKDNFAFAVAHTGYFIGILLAIGSALIGPSKGLVIDLIDLFAYGLLAILLLNLSILINDKIILYKFSVYDEIIRDQNSGVGVIEAASAIGSGLILLGSVSGEVLIEKETLIGHSSGLLFGISSAIIFWLLGQAVLILTTYVYRWITPYDDIAYIEQDNVAVGIGFAGAMVGVSNLIRAALMQDFESWSGTFSEVGIEIIIGLLFLPLARVIADKIFLPGQNLTDELINQEKPNIGAALIEAFAYIGGSVLISWCI